MKYKKDLGFMDGRIKDLGKIIKRIGGEKVRNMGKIGGNIEKG